MSGLVIFDLDGTLIDSSDGVIDAVNYALAHLGKPPLPDHQIKGTIGFPLSRAFAPYPDLNYESAYRLFQDRAATSVCAAAVPLPDADIVLATLKSSGWRLGLATTKNRIHVDAILKKLGWQQYFDATVSGDEVTSVKPAPDIFHAVVGRVRTNSGPVIAVGDTINDLLAARAVPIPAVMVPCPYGGNDLVQQHQPDYTIERLAELPAVLTQIHAHHQRQPVQD